MDTLFVKQDIKHLKIISKEILYIQTVGSYIKLVTLKGEFSLPQNLSEFLRKNSIPKLIRVHRSYAINLARVDSFDNHYLYMGSILIPIGYSHRKDFLPKIRCL